MCPITFPLPIGPYSVPQRYPCRLCVVLSAFVHIVVATNNATNSSILLGGDQAVQVRFVRNLQPYAQVQALTTQTTRF